jgi:hypothetical protein
VILAIALTGCGAAQPRLTTVRIYTPFTPAGRPDVASRMSTGECWIGSLVSPRPDAWRCSTNTDGIIDPCFSDGLDSANVLCPVNGPWGTGARELTLTRSLPPAPRRRDSRPLADPAWALELFGAVRCLFVSGATTVIAGMRENYTCTNGLVLYGIEDRDTEPWTILARRNSGRTLVPVKIASIWF